MLTLKCFEQKKNKDGFAGMTADELKFINGGASSCGRMPDSRYQGKKKK